MLIVDAEVHGHGAALAGVRIAHGRIAAIGDLVPAPGEEVLDAGGGALLPGLHDHHLHLMSYAAALDSVRCGPPEVCSETDLIIALAGWRGAAGRTWLRGIGYHESVAGDIDRGWLDRHGPDAPVRIQHRSGRLWILNSRALQQVAAASGAAAGAAPVPDDGRWYDGDLALREALGVTLPPIGEASRRLAGYGITGVTDMTPHNDGDALTAFARLQAEGSLRQRLRLAGRLDLPPASHPGVTVGETKIHLHETALPPLDELCDTIRRSHGRGRGVAIHCVTETELVFALAAYREAIPRAGDRIEHASVTPPALLDQILELRLTVVTQPGFVAERGDEYSSDVRPAEHDWLYRCRSFLDAGIPLAGSTDAPFGHADPWRAMQAAVGRRSRAGNVLGAAERLTPEQALAMFTGRAEAPAQPRRIAPGEAADLCLLAVPWAEGRTALSSSHVRATLVGGRVVFQRGVREAAD